MKKYEYVLLNRPFDLGVVPKGYIEVTNKRIPNFFSNYGTVIYDRKLTDEEINRFELIDLSEEHFEKVANLIVERMGKYGKKYLELPSHLKAKINDVLSENYSTKIDCMNRLKELEVLVKNKLNCCKDGIYKN